MWFETGSEGVCWAFYKDGQKKWDEAIEFLEAGDHLKIFGEDNSVIFNGKIVPDCKTGWERHYKYARHGQPVALGCWIHWTQKGWKPDDWARLFIRNKGEKNLRAELIKYERGKKK